MSVSKSMSGSSGRKSIAENLDDENVTSIIISLTKVEKEGNPDGHLNLAILETIHHKLLLDR